MDKTELRPGKKRYGKKDSFEQEEFEWVNKVQKNGY